MRVVVSLLAAAVLGVGSPAFAGSPGYGFYVLALNWSPAFCEQHAHVPECRPEDAAEATRFTLHGLWPRDEYCGVAGGDVDADKAGDWNALPEPDLSPTTRGELDAVMPGTQSLLERHEWIAHGTCSDVGADTYFHRAALFAGTIDNSAVGALLAARVGKRLDRTDLQRAFDTAFGDGAGQRIKITCVNDGDRYLISGITVGLYGDVMGTGGIGELIAAAHPTSPGCNGGILDPVGLQ